MNARLGVGMLLLVGCGPEAPKPFQEFKDVFNPVLVVNAGSLPGQGEALQVLVHPDRSGTCRPLPKLTATLDGVPLTRLSGKVEGPNGYERDCMVYEFAADATLLATRPVGTGATAPDGKGVDGTVVVTDGETTLSTTITNLFATRTLTQEGTVGPDGKVRLTWRPGGDRVDPKVKPAIVLRGAFKELLIRPPALELTPEAVSFTLPPEATGAVSAEFTGTLAVQPTVAACTGAFRCEASRTYLVPPVDLKR